MDYKSITASLKKKQFSPVYLLHGNEEFYIDKVASIFETEILNETEKAFNYHLLYGKDAEPNQIIELARQFPVMSDYKLIILREAKSMKDLKDFVNYFKFVNPATIIVIVHKHGKLDGKTKLYKEIKKIGTIFLSEQIREYQVAGWVKKYVQETGYKIDDAAAAMLSEFIGANLTNLTNELGKIFLNVEKGVTINKDIVLDQVGINKDFNEFELQKAISERNITKAHQIILYFSNNTKSHPLVVLLGTLASYYSRLFIAKSLRPSLSDNEFASAVGIGSPYFAKEYKRAATHYTMREIENCIHTVHEFDLRSKGVNNNNFSDGELMKELIERLLFIRYLA